MVFNRIQQIGICLYVTQVPKILEIWTLAHLVNPVHPPKVWPFFDYNFRDKSKVFHIFMEKSLPSASAYVKHIVYQKFVLKIIIFTP